MKTKIIPIGNSKGMRIPNAIIKQCNFKDELEVIVKDNCMVVCAAKKKPREGWEEKINKAFANAKPTDDDMCIPDTIDEHLLDEWRVEKSDQSI